MESCSYTEFTNRIHGRVAGERVPLDVTIEVTRRCPLQCAHCYNNLPMADPEARRGELRTEELVRLLDELADAGTLWLLFTGGEIFARADFLDVYLHAKRRGFLVTLFTNGTLITERIADTLAAYRPFSIEITLYGRTRETYERLTGVPGSYDKCLRGIRLLKERGLPLALKTVAVTVNRHEIADMKAFAEQELGVPFRYDAMMTPRIDCSATPLAVRLGPEEIVALDLQDPVRMRGWDDLARDYIRPQQPPGHERDVYHCGGGVQSCNIAPDGKMSVCLLSQQSGLDLRASTVRAGWTGYVSSERARQARRVTKCTHCQMKSVCGMCPANAELEAGDSETPVDFLCHVAHLRALTFGWEFPEHGECEYCPGGARRAEVAREAGALHKDGGRRAASRRTVVLPLARVEAGGASACGGSCGGRDAATEGR